MSMNKMNKKALFTLAFGGLALTGCGDVVSSRPGSSVQNGQFDYEDPGTNIVSQINSGIVSESSSEGRAENFGDLSIEVIATIDGNGTFVAEAEDCDTSGCTLQAGCAGFYESTSFASGGVCIACIASPSILAFSFELKGDCTVEFQTVSAKYENPWNLDNNVSYFVDKSGEDTFSHTLTSNGYTAFGRDPANNNDWYNFKTVSLGSLDLLAGTHTMYIKVSGNFPNTDCFNLIATNYAAA